VIGFTEKGAEAGAGWINAGVYLIARSLLQTIPTGRPVSLEQEVFPSWIGQGLYGYAGEGRFWDIGTPESYTNAEEFFSKG
jgi:NDP-sugar pyrophosphorylase family protein